MFYNLTNNLNKALGIIIFITISLLLVVRSLYGAGLILVLLIALSQIKSFKHNLSIIPKGQLVILFASVLYAIYRALSEIIFNSGNPVVPKYYDIYFLLLPIAYLGIINFKISWNLIAWSSISCVSIAGIYTIIEWIVFTQNKNYLEYRANGSTYAIAFGNFLLLFISFSVISILNSHLKPIKSFIGFTNNKYVSIQTKLIAVVAIILGCTVLALSQAKTAFVAIPVAIAIVSWHLYIINNPKKIMYLLLGALSIIATTLISPVGNILTNNFSDAVSGIVKEDIDIQSKYTDTYSGSLRRHMWIHAFEQFKSNPLLGVGTGNYKEVKNSAIKSESGEELGYLNNELLRFNQAHSQYLTILAENGIVGFILLIFMFGSTFLYFLFEHFKTRSIFSLAGLLLITLFGLFGVTETVFSRSIFINMYILFLTLFMIGCLQSDKYNDR